MLKYIFLGITQGLTEFFPVSSSAHLVIAQRVLGIDTDALSVSVLLHLGTCLSLILFFFKDIVRLLYNRRLCWFIITVTLITVTLITGSLGLWGKDFFESVFASLGLISAALLITGIILILAGKLSQARKDVPSIKDAFILGVVQAIAIIPGISRSGMTISTLLFRGIDKEMSFRLSFLASIPAVLGATALEAKKIGFAFSLEPACFLAGFLSSLASGIISLWILKIVMRRAKLHYFGYYCISQGAFVFLFLR